MSSIYSENILGGLLNFKKWLFRFAVGLLIFAVILGAMTILVGDASVETAKLIGQFMGTVFIIGIMMLCTSIDIKLIDSRKPAVQVLATIGLIFNLLWAIFWIIICWVPETVTCTTYTCEFKPLLKIAVICTSLSLFGMLCGAIMNMYEGKRKDIILPLKITTAALLGYGHIYSVIYILTDGHVNDRFALLSGYAGALWFVLWLVTLGVSLNEKRKNNELQAAANTNATAPVVKTEPKEEPKAEPDADAALRKEIEEKVRREMIEKEVRAEIEKEKAEKKED